MARESKTYSKEYYAKNKDKLKAYSKDYRAKNKDRIKKRNSEYGKEYRAKNRDKLAEKHKRYRAENMDAFVEYDKGYYELNKEKRKEYHRDHYKSAEGRYRAIKNNARRRQLTFELGLDDFRDNFYGKPCHYCLDECTGIDRVDNSQGYVAGNMVPCCWPCNEMKNDKSADEFQRQIFKIYKNLNNQP